MFIINERLMRHSRMPSQLCPIAYATALTYWRRTAQARRALSTIRQSASVRPAGNPAQSDRHSHIRLSAYHNTTHAPQPTHNCARSAREPDNSDPLCLNHAPPLSRHPQNGVAMIKLTSPQNFSFFNSLSLPGSTRGSAPAKYGHVHICGISSARGWWK